MSVSAVLWSSASRSVSIKCPLSDNNECKSPSRKVYFLIQFMLLCLPLDCSTFSPATCNYLLVSFCCAVVVANALLYLHHIPMNHFSEVCLPHHIHSNLTSYQPSFVPSLTGSHLLLQSAKQILTSYEPDLSEIML
jgi:hypothetical protein